MKVIFTLEAPEIESNQTSGQLRRILGVTFGIAITIGGMIGLGILRTPGLVARDLQEPWLIILVWTLGGVYALFGVFSIAELCTSIPCTGGWYTYARRAFGEYPGFAAGFIDWIAYPATLALTAITAAEYGGRLFRPLESRTTLTAISIMLALAVLNWFGLRIGSRFQEVLSFVKAAALVIVVGAAFFSGSSGGGSTSISTSTGSLGMLGAVVIALQSVIYTYDGWYAAAYFSEETENPGQNLPRAMILAVVAVGAIYVFVNAALLYALPMETLSNSSLPVADVANMVFGSSGETVITVLALVTLLSLLNGNLLTAPRIMYAISRDGLFTKSAAEVNSGGTPSVALLIIVIVTLPFILINSIETILAVSAFLFILLYLFGFAAVFALRQKEPEMFRPYRAWGYPWTTGIMFFGSLAFLIAAVMSDTSNSLIAIVVLLTSYPVYRIFKWLNGRTGPAAT